MVAAGVVAAALFGAPVSAAPTQVADIIVVDSDPESGLKVEDLAPGDTTEWAVTVRNVAGRQVPVSTLFTTALDDEGTALTTDPVDGLHAGLNVCSQQWTPGVAGPVDARIFTCGGSETIVLPEVAVAHVVDVPFSMTNDLGAGAEMHIRVRIRFPESAGNEFENLDGGLRIDFESSYADDPEPTEPPTPTTPEVPEVPGEPGRPGQPGSPPEPGSPGVPAEPDPPSRPPWRDVPLIRTGSDVFGLAVVGVAAIVGGSILRAGAKGRREHEEPQEASGTQDTADQADTPASDTPAGSSSGDTDD